jgi:hypothetical protein
MMYPARFNKDRVHLLGQRGTEDDRHHKLNFDLCNAVNLGALSMALEELIKAGMPLEQAEAFMRQAEALRALLCTENNRLHGF